MNPKVIEALKELRGLHGVPKPSNGICGNLRALLRSPLYNVPERKFDPYWDLEPYFKTWEHTSGEESNPISWELEGSKWDKDQPQGKARYQLIDHIISEMEKEPT